MERQEACIPHDLEPTSLGALALQKFIDELYPDGFWEDMNSPQDRPYPTRWC